MKLKIVYSLLIILASAFLITGSSSGRANAADEGNTGAPGDNNFNNRTCQGCHNSPQTQVTLDMVARNTVGEEINNYQPGHTYNISVTINTFSGNPSVYGFQMVCLTQSNLPVNNWVNPTGNVNFVTASNGRMYAEHFAPSAENTFTVEWVAPEAGTGPVTFFACGNGANNDGKSQGDGAAPGTLVFPEATNTGTADQTIPTMDLRLVPNPLTGQELFLELPEAPREQALLQLFTLQGQLIHQNTVQLQGDSPTTLKLPQLTQGFYWVRINGANFRADEKLMVL